MQVGGLPAHRNFLLRLIAEPERRCNDRSINFNLRLVAELPTGVAEMVALRVIVGLDVADVARIVGKTPGAVRVALHRGLRTLAGRYGSNTPSSRL